MSVLASALLGGCGGPFQPGDTFYWRNRIYIVNGISTSGLKFTCDLGHIDYRGVRYEVCSVDTKPLTGRMIALHAGLFYYLAGTDIH